MSNGELEIEQLRIAYQERLRDFIEVEIKLGFTFAEFAQIERDSGNVEHFQHARLDAERAVASIRYFLSRISDPQAQAVATEQLEKLTQTVSAL